MSNIIDQKKPLLHRLFDELDAGIECLRQWWRTGWTAVGVALVLTVTVSLGYSAVSEGRYGVFGVLACVGGWLLAGLDGGKGQPWITVPMGLLLVVGVPLWLAVPLHGGLFAHLGIPLFVWWLAVAACLALWGLYYNYKHPPQRPESDPDYNHPGTIEEAKASNRGNRGVKTE